MIMPAGTTVCVAKVPEKTLRDTPFLQANRQAMEKPQRLHASCAQCRDNHAPTSAIKRAMSTGLVMCTSNPAASAFSLSLGCPQPVMATRRT